MKTNLMKKIVVMVIFIMTITLVSSFSYAASSVTIAAGSTSLTVGSSTTLTIRANNVTGRINITSSNPGVVALSSSSEWVENGTVTVRATAKAAGSAYITVSSADTSDSTTGDPVAVSTGVNLTAKEVVIDTRSSNNYLSSLYQSYPEIVLSFSYKMLALYLLASKKRCLAFSAKHRFAFSCKSESESYTPDYFRN